MPDRVYSALNTGGTSVGTPEDQIALTNAARSQDWMVQQAMMAQNAQRLQAQLADSAANRTQQLQLQGTYAQKSADARTNAGIEHGYGLEDIAANGTQNQALERIKIGPNQTYADLALQSYLDQATKRKYENAVLDQQTQSLGLQGGIQRVIGGQVGRTFGLDASGSPLPASAQSPTASANPADYTGLNRMSPYPYTPSASGPSPMPSQQGGQGQVDPYILRAFTTKALGIAPNPIDAIVSNSLTSTFQDPNRTPEERQAALTAARSGDYSSLPAPLQSPDKAAQSSPEAAFAIKQIMQHVAIIKNQGTSDPQAEASAIKKLVPVAIQALVSRGARQSDAQAYLKNMIEGELPAPVAAGTEDEHFSDYLTDALPGGAPLKYYFGKGDVESRAAQFRQALQ